MLFLFAFKQTNSEISAVSVMDRLVRPIAREFEPLTLSLEEWIEVTIFGLKIMVVQGLLSFHHLESLGQFLATFATATIPKTNQC